MLRWRRLSNTEYRDARIAGMPVLEFERWSEMFVRHTVYVMLEQFNVSDNTWAPVPLIEGENLRWHERPDRG